ncbi:SDR family oxidoreductase [Kitasatospora cinereorecta]|uniref:SDR family NAD(P)-dependent oxidoreductase n=1 Tax=Kitasatospora cinereorecta TaxID=285560 RepID=A0ABW0VC25_9ACTN
MNQAGNQYGPGEEQETVAAKRAFVTGTSHGLGARLATRLAEDGWQVTGLGRRPRSETALPPEVRYLQADLSDPKALDELPALIGETPDLIVHNAVSYPPRDVSALTLDELEGIFRVNSLVPYRLTLDLLAAKPPERFCSVVVVNSESIYHADFASGVYAASKAALRVLTTSLADHCRSRNAAVATLLLGPLADPGKVADLRAVAERRGVTEAEITRLFLRKSNPDLVIEQLIDFDACVRSVRYIADLGTTANGMMCKLDGGSSGSLV